LLGLKLTSKTESTVDAIRTTDDGNSDWNGVSRQIPQASLETDPTQPAYVLTDVRGTILGSSVSTTIFPWKKGDRIEWRPDRQSRGVDGPVYGRIADHSGGRLALSYKLKGGERQLIVFAALPTAPQWKASVQRALPVASGLGFFWTLSLSIVAVSLLAGRMGILDTNKKADVDHDALRNVQDLLRTRDAVIFGLAKLAESRDPETGHHLERISLYTTQLASALRPYPKYQRTITPTFVRLLGISSVLHDIGKVGVEDTVLLKPGKLTKNEFLRMQQHTIVAGECLREIEQRLGASNFLQTAREIALHHHERWDGKGYPYGL